MTGRQWIKQIVTLCSDLDAELPVILKVREDVGGHWKITSQTQPGEYMAYPTLSGTSIAVELDRGGKGLDLR